MRKRERSDPPLLWNSKATLLLSRIYSFWPPFIYLYLIAHIFTVAFLASTLYVASFAFVLAETVALWAGRVFGKLWTCVVLLGCLSFWSHGKVWFHEVGLLIGCLWICLVRVHVFFFFLFGLESQDLFLWSGLIVSFTILFEGWGFRVLKQLNLPCKWNFVVNLEKVWYVEFVVKDLKYEGRKRRRKGD